MAFKERIDLLIISGERFGYKSSSENINKQLELFKYLFHSVHLISFCNKNLIRGIDNNDFSFIISKKSNISQFFWSQINIGIEILRLSRNKEISRAIFISGSDLQTIPILICKLLTEDVIIRSDCRPTMALKKYIKNHSLIRMLLFKFLEEINYRSVDLVLTECDYLIKENDLIQYNCRSANWYIDTDKFRIIRPFDERRYTLAYVGRLDIDKGILTFLELLDLLDEDHRVLILGDGPCRNKVENKIKFEKNSNIEVTYVDWVERDELPCYLNEIKLLVLPTLREGLPNTVLEAMACGTIILSTPVGAIPYILKDGLNGFQIKTNTPDYINMKIRSIYRKYDLVEIGQIARQVIINEFSFESTVEKWSSLFEKR